MPRVHTRATGPPGGRRPGGVVPAPACPRRRAWSSQRQAFACGVMPPCAASWCALSHAPGGAP